MSAAKKETAWVFVPPQTVHKITHDDSTADQKRLATTIALLAIAGHAVHKIELGFLVCRWGQTKVCRNLAELVGFARQVGVAQ